MFIRLRHGDNEMALVNTDCHRIHFDRYVKQLIAMTDKEVVDILDQNGRLVGLVRRALWDYVSSIPGVADRKMYYPIALRIGRHQEVKEIRPLVKNFAKRHPDWMENLETQLAVRTSAKSKQKQEKDKHKAGKKSKKAK